MTGEVNHKVKRTDKRLLTGECVSMKGETKRRILAEEQDKLTKMGEGRKNIYDNFENREEQ